VEQMLKKTIKNAKEWEFKIQNCICIFFFLS